MGNYTKPVCKGSWKLGTACGKCERCEETWSMTNQPDDLVVRLGDEADLCRNDGANDIADLLDEAAAYIKELKAEVERCNIACDTQAGWHSSEVCKLTNALEAAEARAAKAEEALRKIKARATAHPDDNDSDRKRDLRLVVGIAREALGEEKA